MASELEFISGGTVTSPLGFKAGATYAGIKKQAENVLDLGILFSEVPCTVAAMFTTNLIKSAPIVLCKERVQSGRARAVVINSGCANACTGEQGMADATLIAELAARQLGISPQDVLVASTGVIGQPLPMDLIQSGIKRLSLSADGGHELERAIMTTDTVPKEVAVNAGKFTIGGIAKGSGMIHPNMATMLCFLTTDAAVNAGFLKTALKKAVDVSFNMISVDGDTSTNDMVLVMANGQANNNSISEGSDLADVFQRALTQACIYLAKGIVRDGEGATKLIEVTVEGAPNVADARLAAKAVIGSSLVKSAVYGGDPNWGRILAAVGRSGVSVVESKIDLYIGETCLLKGGRPQSFDLKVIASVFKKPEVPIRVSLNLGTASATAWGCDLSVEYVKINSHYMT